MSRNHNKLRRPGAWGAVAVAVGPLVLTACVSSSSNSSANTPRICETGRVNSPQYQPFPGATNRRNTWGGEVIRFSHLNISGVFAIITAWRAQSSDWQWVESNANTPEELFAHHNAIIMQAGNGAVPTEHYDDMIGDGLAPKWGTSTSQGEPNPEATASRLSFAVTPAEVSRLLAA